MAKEHYTDSYKEKVFFLWHEGGRKISPRFVNSLPMAENGFRPGFKTVEQWRDSHGWIERADALDAEISSRFQTEAVNKRIKMYEEHIEVSNSLISRGKQFLENNPIDEMPDALKAISLGIEIQKASVGQIEMGQKILQMSNTQLLNEITKLLGAPEVSNDDEIVDSVAIDEEEDVP